MIKILKILDNEYSAEKIYKTKNSIYGTTNNIEVFRFEGIKNFDIFSLSDGSDWDVEIDEIEEIKKENLKLNQYILDLEFRLSKQELNL